MFRMKNKTLKNVDTKTVVKNSGTYFVLLLALGAMTFFGVCNPRNGRMADLAGNAASVDGDDISSRQFIRTYRMMSDRYQQQQGSDFNPKAMKLAENVLNQLVDERINYILAGDLGISASDEEILKLLLDAEVFKGEKGTFSSEKFQNYLQVNQTSERELKNDLLRSQTISKLRTMVASIPYISKKAAALDEMLSQTKLKIDYLELKPDVINVNVSPDEIKKFITDKASLAKVQKYYDDNKSIYHQDEKLKARHILIAFKGTRNVTGEAAKRSKEDALKRAQQVLALVKKTPKNFPELAKQWTDEASGKKSGGDLGEFKRDDMVKEFSTAAFNLKADGDLSDIVESPFGYHIIQRLGRVSPVNRTFDQTKEEIAHLLIAKDKKPKLLGELATKFVTSLKDEAQLKALINENHLAWKESEEFSLSSPYIKDLGSDDRLLEAIYSLAKPGDLYPNYVQVGEKYYFLRLKSKQAPNPEQFKDTELDRVAQGMAYRSGYALYSTIEKKRRKQFEDKGKIWLNPKFLELDQQTNDNSGG